MITLLLVTMITNDCVIGGNGDNDGGNGGNDGGNGDDDDCGDG